MEKRVTQPHLQAAAQKRPPRHPLAEHSEGRLGISYGDATGDFARFFAALRMTGGALRVTGLLALLFFSIPARAEQALVTSFLNPPYPAKLSSWKLFVKQADMWELGEAVVPYDLVNPLFSDYALKFRTLWLPAGQQITYQSNDELLYPTGTIISKTFAYPRDKLKILVPPGRSTGVATEGFSPAMQALSGLYRVETRLMIKRPQGWMGLPYVWDSDQNDATLQLIGASLQLDLEHEEFSDRKTFTYQVPNANQCKGCHIRQEGFTKTMLPIGPRMARNLNRIYTYVSGPANQLQQWQELGLLTGLPPLDEVPQIAQWDKPSESSERRARAYLESNCAHCHQASGPASTSGLILNWEEQSLSALGFCKTPVAAGNAGGGLRYDIVPGSPEASLLYYRLASEDPAVMMPELGRSLRHESGLAVIRGWIEGLGGGCR